MFKIAIVLCIISLSNSMAATIELNTLVRKKINVGELTQNQNQAVKDILIFTRTSDTPKKVSLSFSFNYFV